MITNGVHAFAEWIVGADPLGPVDCRTGCGVKLSMPIGVDARQPLRSVEAAVTFADEMVFEDKIGRGVER